MRFLLAATALAGLATLGGCYTPCPDVAGPPTRVVFACEDGSELDVTFTSAPDHVRILQEGYAPVDMDARVSGSGYRYADNGAELRGSATSVRWTRPGAAETECRRKQ